MRFAEPRKNAFRKESVKGGLPPKEYRRKAEKGFNWIVRGFVFGVLNRGLQNLGASCEGERIVTFCIVQKVTKKHARGLRTSGLRGRFKALPEKIMQSFQAARVETGFAYKTPAKRL